MRLVGAHAAGPDALLQVVTLGSAPANAVARTASMSGVDAVLLLDSPFGLLARGAREAAAALERGERSGFDGVITHQSHLEALGESHRRPQDHRVAGVCDGISRPSVRRWG